MLSLIGTLIIREVIFNCKHIEVTTFWLFYHWSWLTLFISWDDQGSLTWRGWNMETKVAFPFIRHRKLWTYFQDVSPKKKKNLLKVLFWGFSQKTIYERFWLSSTNDTGFQSVWFAYFCMSTVLQINSISVFSDTCLPSFSFAFFILFSCSHWGRELFYVCGYMPCVNFFSFKRGKMRGKNSPNWRKSI